jgi:hypothetical protein
MEIIRHAPILDDILGRWRAPLGGDFASYRNHGYRVLNFCLAIGGSDDASVGKVSVATAFHDLGIWAEGTFDYLAPSIRLAREYLAREQRPDWTEEVAAMIDGHHKITRHRAGAAPLVEPFRRADWIDVTSGVLRYGLPRPFIRDVQAAFPDEGFHRHLLSLTAERFRAHPLSPLPMVKL